MTDKRIAFARSSQFQTTLRRRVDDHLREVGRRDGGSAMVVKTLTIFAWFFASYLSFILLAPGPALIAALGVSTGLAMAGLGMAVQHDGGHRAYSSDRRVNRASAAVLDLLGASSYVWHVKHGVVHHSFANIEGVDDDISAEPFGRLAPGQPHRWFHRAQHLYMWPLYGVLIAKWFWYDDFRDLANGRIGEQPMRRPAGSELALFVGGKLVHLAWSVVIPILALGWGPWALFYVCMHAAAGITLSVVFQLAHCVEEAEFYDPAALADAPLDYSAHQLATTIDFARRSRLITWYVGGLNFQAIHHLFPRVCHLHYPALSPIVAQTCREFGVPYKTSPTLWASLGSHFRWLRRMGRGEVRELEASPGELVELAPQRRAA